MPQHLAAREPSEDGGGHIVEDHFGRDPVVVLEAHGQALEQRGLPLVAGEVQRQPARVAQEAAERVYHRRSPADHDGVGRPVDLQLLTRPGLEAALHRFAHCDRELRPQRPHMVGQNGTAPRVAQLP